MSNAVDVRPEYEALAELASRHDATSVDEWEAAGQLLQECDQPMRDAFALIALAEKIKARRRFSQLLVERESVVRLETVVPALEPIRQESNAEKFVRWRRDPGSITSDEASSRVRRAFVRDLQNRGKYEAWRKKAEAIVVAGGKVAFADGSHGTPDLETFEEDWNPRGVWGRWEDNRAKQELLTREYITELQGTIGRLELSNKLLLSKFALGDGTKVAWGSATVADHRQRIELLFKNALANGEAAARHAKAIEMIEEAGVQTLGEVAA